MTDAEAMGREILSMVRETVMRAAERVSVLGSGRELTDAEKAMRTLLQDIAAMARGVGDDE